MYNFEMEDDVGTFRKREPQLFTFVLTAPQSPR